MAPLSLRSLGLLLFSSGQLAAGAALAGTGTPTAPVQAVETPQPAQPSMVPNCVSFYRVRRGETCESVAATHGISVGQFQRWNAGTGPGCTALVADAWACVGVKDEPSPTPTDKPVATPLPIQDGMVKNCRRFHHVDKEQRCEAIEARYGVSLEDLVRWNPAIGKDCTNMWANYYLCVGVA
ncbi:hypothetical protein CDD83_1070 [Cordyceps sp. RAO-2017]|nr:hypothetical protein CDD83_1070 [Cordyceps sp. RAO-2017]